MTAVGNGGFLLELPTGVQYVIVNLLDRRSLGCVASTCHSLREFALGAAGTIRVPNAASGRVLLHAAFQKLTSARSLKLSGDYPSLSPACFEIFLQTRLPTLAPSLTELLLHGVRLSAPLPLSLVQSIPELWPNLRRLELVDTRLNCPLSCTKREKLESCVRSLLDIDERGQPPGLILSLVDEHEQRMERNLLVSLELCRAAGRLVGLKALVLRGHAFMHLHNLAVMALSTCTALETLELDLPPSWPMVTGFSLQCLPPSLQSLTLGCHRPVSYMQALAGLPIRACHLQVDFQAPGWVLGGFYGHGRYTAAGLDIFGTEYDLALSAALSPVTQLVSLSIRSAVPDRDPEDLSSVELAQWQRQQADEGKLLAAVLAAAPQLQKLELSGVGPLMFQHIVPLVEQVPSQVLRLSCHSTVDPMLLLYHRVRADLSLTLRGVTVPDLMALCGGKVQHVPEEQPEEAAAATAGAPGSSSQQKGRQQQQQQQGQGGAAARGKRALAVSELQQQAAYVSPAMLPSDAKKQQQGSSAAGGSAEKAGASKMNKKAQKKAAAAAAAAALAEKRQRQQEEQQLQQRQQQLLAALKQQQESRWQLQQGAPIQARLVEVHLQRSHEVTDADVARAVAACRTLRSVQLTTCRSVSWQIVL